MKNIYFTMVISSLLVVATSVTAQTKISVKDLQPFLGNWKGSLTYIDYSSGKPYTMPANIEIKKGLNAKQLLVSNIYPNEPKANSVDTILISEKGDLFNKAPIKSIIKLKNGSKQIVTENSGTDGNDNKPAIIRHVYTIDKLNYTNRKDVQFVGEKTWIKRHEYSYLKTL